MFRRTKVNQTSDSLRRIDRDMRFLTNVKAQLDQQALDYDLEKLPEALKTEQKQIKDGIIAALDALQQLKDAHPVAAYDYKEDVTKHWSSVRLFVEKLEKYPHLALLTQMKPEIVIRVRRTKTVNGANTRSDMRRDLLQLLEKTSLSQGESIQITKGEKHNGQRVFLISATSEDGSQRELVQIHQERTIEAGVPYVKMHIFLSNLLELEQKQLFVDGFLALEKHIAHSGSLYFSRFPESSILKKKLSKSIIDKDKKDRESPALDYLSDDLESVASSSSFESAESMQIDSDGNIIDRDGELTLSPEYSKNDGLNFENLSALSASILPPIPKGFTVALSDAGPPQNSLPEHTSFLAPKAIPVVHELDDDLPPNDFLVSALPESPNDTIAEEHKKKSSAASLGANAIFVPRGILKSQSSTLQSKKSVSFGEREEISSETNKRVSITPLETGPAVAAPEDVFNAEKIITHIDSDDVPQTPNNFGVTSAASVPSMPTLTSLRERPNPQAKSPLVLAAVAQRIRDGLKVAGNVSWFKQSEDRPDKSVVKKPKRRFSIPKSRSKGNPDEEGIELAEIRKSSVADVAQSQSAPSSDVPPFVPNTDALKTKASKPSAQNLRGLGGAFLARFRSDSTASSVQPKASWTDDKSVSSDLSQQLSDLEAELTPRSMTDSSDSLETSAAGVLSFHGLAPSDAPLAKADDLDDWEKPDFSTPIRLLAKTAPEAFNDVLKATKKSVLKANKSKQKKSSKTKDLGPIKTHEEKIHEGIEAVTNKDKAKDEFSLTKSDKTLVTVNRVKKSKKNPDVTEALSASAADKDPEEQACELMLRVMWLSKRKDPNKSFSIDNCEDNPALALRFYMGGIVRGLEPILPEKTLEAIRGDSELLAIYEKLAEQVVPYEAAVQKLKKAKSLKIPGLTAKARARITEERSKAIEQKKSIKDIFNTQKTKLDEFKRDQNTLSSRRP